MKAAYDKLHPKGFEIVGISFDQDGFDRAMSEQRTRAQASWKPDAKQSARPVYQQLAPTIFEGYRQTESSGCRVLALVRQLANAMDARIDVRNCEPGAEFRLLIPGR